MERYGVNAPRPIPAMSDADWRRFWMNVERKTTGDCWLWKGARFKAGYGAFSVRGGLFGAHRIAVLGTQEPVSTDLHVLHSCNNPLCVNPAHLSLGTHQENMQDLKDSGRARSGALRGESSPVSKLTENDVREIRRIYAAGGVSYKKVGERFGVSGSAVLHIVRRLRWAHVE